MKVLLIYWIILSLSRELTTNRVDPTSEFSVSTNHSIFAGIYTTLIFSLIIWFIFVKRENVCREVNRAATTQYILFSYYMVSVFWSSNIMVSLGQAIYSIYGLIFSILIAQVLKSKRTLENSISIFIKFWVMLLLIDYIIKLIFVNIRGEKIMPALDEFSLIAIVLLIIMLITDNKSSRMKITLLMLYLFGNSFSALVIGLLPILQYIRIKFGNVIRNLIYLILILLVTLMLDYIINNQGSLYGKTIEYFISGSGRFMVWEKLIEEIWNRPMAEFIFGSGYMTERTFLTSINVPWVIDAHNNIIQTLYGTGVVGLILMILVWYGFDKFLRSKKLIDKIGSNLIKILLVSNLSFILFGLTSSHYFSRPSMSATFFSSLIFLIAIKKKSNIKVTVSK